jgi:hypothetical protein
MIDRRRNHVTGYERPLEQRAPQHLPRPDQPQILLRRRELHALGWAHIGGTRIDVIADADPRVAALQPVQPNDIQPFVFRIGRQHDRRGRPLADDLDDLAFPQIQILKRLPTDARGTGPDILRLGARDLKSGGLALRLFGHVSPQLDQRPAWGAIIVQGP